MKYTKKMKLVELDNGHLENNMQCSSLLSDSNYTAPRVFSTLDELMNKILNAADLSDNDKWILYNQTLQRYLNYMKNINRQKPSIQSESQAIQNRTISDIRPQDVTLSDFRANTSLSFNNSINDMTGVETMRDSLDSIQQPNVRTFFENLREQNMNKCVSSPEDQEDTNNKRVYRRAKVPKNQRKGPSYGNHLTRSRTAPKRRTDALLSGMKPCKVLIRPVRLDNWVPSNLN